MFTSITLRNFRAFGETEQRIDLAPFTLFV
jgi:hypothetical protein